MHKLKNILKIILGYLHFFRLSQSINQIINEVEVVFFFPYYHTGGAERVHASIVASLAPKKSLVIFTKASATDAVLSDFKLNAFTVELNSILNKKDVHLNTFLKRYLLKKINKSRTVKKVFGANSDYFYELLPHFTSTLVCIDLFHAFSPEDYRAKMVASSAPFITHRIVINQKAKEAITHYYQLAGINSFDNRIQIISNGVHLPKTDLVLKKSPLKIGFVGRWSEEKRPELFLQAAQKIKTQFPNVVFFMAGSGTRVHQQKIENHGVELLGDIHNPDLLATIYAETSVLVLTSVYEGFPMVFMEGMSYGCVPVSTNVGGIAAHIQSHQNGLLIEAKSETDILRELVQQLNFLITNPDVLTLMSTNCMKYASSHFSIEHFNKAYQKLLQ